MNIEALSSSGRLRIALVGVWGAVVLAALVGLSRYQLTAGVAAEVRERWPETSALAAGTDRPTLIMFAHPRCPCTRASLGELRRLLSRFAGRMVTHVVFMRPADSSTSWSHTDAWATASSLASVHVATDIDGREAELFGATTSGHVVLHDAQGRLLFSGGITPGRGHQGASPQLDQLARLLERETAGAARVSAAPWSPLRRPGPVYGCALREDLP